LQRSQTGWQLSDQNFHDSLLAGRTQPDQPAGASPCGCARVSDLQRFGMSDGQQLSVPGQASGKPAGHESLVERCDAAFPPLLT
jgi:hypothetical protein